MVQLATKELFWELVTQWLRTCGESALDIV